MEKKPIKPRLEQITPAHIVDSWRMLDRSIKDTKGHPDCSEESGEVIRSHLFQRLCAPDFFGLMLKVGRRPVGQIMAQIVVRPFGAPRRFALIWDAWIEPEFRKKGYMAILYKEFFARLKTSGVHHWEGEAHEGLAELLLKYPKYEVKKISVRIGGRC